MALSGNEVTRLWPYGGSGHQYGSFAGKAGTPPTITTISLPDATVGVAYSETLEASGSAPITWAVTVGVLPDGLSLDANTGVISGTPTTAGSETFTVEATNVAGSDTQELTITVAVVANIPMGGAGYPVPPSSVYWQGRRKKRTLADEPEKHLRQILDKVVAEYYGDLVESDVPAAVKAEAAEVVRPFVKRAAKNEAVPEIAEVNWKKLAKDAEQVRELLDLWKREIWAREMEAEDEYLLLM